MEKPSFLHKNRPALDKRDIFAIMSIRGALQQAVSPKDYKFKARL